MNDVYDWTDDDPTCDNCGGVMTWCSCCKVWSQDCCVDYGTCQCS